MYKHPEINYQPQHPLLNFKPSGGEYKPTTKKNLIKEWTDLETRYEGWEKDYAKKLKKSLRPVKAKIEQVCEKEFEKERKAKGKKAGTLGNYKASCKKRKESSGEYDSEKFKTWKNSNRYDLLLDLLQAKYKVRGKTSKGGYIYAMGDDDDWRNTYSHQGFRDMLIRAMKKKETAPPKLPNAAQKLNIGGNKPF